MTCSRALILVLTFTFCINVFAQLELGLPETRIQEEEDSECVERLTRCNRNFQVLVNLGERLWNTTQHLALQENNLQNKKLELELEAKNLRDQLNGVHNNRGRPVVCAWPGGRDGSQFLESIGNCSTLYVRCVSRLAFQKRLVRDKKRVISMQHVNIKITKEKIQKIEEEISYLQEKIKQKMFDEQLKVKQNLRTRKIQLEPTTTLPPLEDKQVDIYLVK